MGKIHKIDKTDGICVDVSMYVCWIDGWICVCFCIYIYRERERSRYIDRWIGR